MSRTPVSKLPVARLFLPILVAPVLLGLGAAGACSTPGRAPSAPLRVPEQSEQTAVRTTVEFGPGTMLTAEIVRIGADARAVARTPAGLFGAEIVIGDDHYVRIPDAAPAIGGDRWIHTELSDPRQRRYLERNPTGFIDLADLADLRVGAEFAGHEVLSSERPRDGVVVFDFGEGRTIEVTTETLDEAPPIVAPDAAEVVALTDIPEAAAAR